MNLKVGIVGLPNAGKSTLFNALLKKQVAEAANYPFTTIEPNIGVVPVPDERLEKLADIIASEHTPDVKEVSTSGVKEKRPPIVPAVVQFVDIAGLVKGASEGEGLGNKFLSHIREVDLIVNVLREFEDPAVIHVAGNVDPERDRGIIETELMLADLQTLGNQKVKSEIVQKFTDALNHGTPARDIGITEEQRHEVADLHFLTMKPVLYVANVSEEQLSNFPQPPKGNPTIPPLTLRGGEEGLRGGEGGVILAICAKIESELASLSEEEQKAYLKELGLEASGLDRLIQKAYAMLGLISFLTCGVKEVRAWTIKHGTKAPAAAGVIHTDFEKKFIKADVVSFPEFIGPASTREDASSMRGGWKALRDKGLVRSEGREYMIEDGDVVEFKIGA